MSSDDRPRRESGSWFLGLLDTHEYIADDENRTTQTLRLMPWLYLFFLTTCVVAVVLVAAVTGHLHAAVIARSTLVRWTVGSVLGASAITRCTMAVRRRVRKEPKRLTRRRRGRRKGQSACTQQVKQASAHGRVYAARLPAGRDGNRNRHQRPHGQKSTPRNDNRGKST